MLIFFKNFACSPNKAMQHAGYSFRRNANDWVKDDGSSGRYHIKRVNSRVVDIHYDTFIEGRHVVFQMPERLTLEKYRILKLMQKYKFRDLTDSEFHKLLDKHSDRVRMDD